MPSDATAGYAEASTSFGALLLGNIIWVHMRHAERLGPVCMHISNLL